MTISRRDALMATLFGGSMIGLRSIATGLPAKMILEPKKALDAEYRRRRRLVAHAMPEAREGIPAELVLAADQFIITPAGRTEETARAHGLSTMRLPSGAGHDAQMLARVCPAGMVFVPSVRGISHNPAELTEDPDLEAGANVLLHVLLRLAGAR